jgi:hypothetical protein
MSSRATIRDPAFQQLDSGLMKLLAIRLSWPKTPAKSLVMRRNDGQEDFKETT